MRVKLKGKEENEGRIAIIDAEKCKPKKCGLQCKLACPVNRTERVCVVVEKTSPTSLIVESMCIGCGQCVRACPFEAIKIVKLPKNLPDEVAHRFGPNQFVLYRLPTPRLGSVLGLIGVNGIGKTTALKILTRNLTPNLGRLDDPPAWPAVIKHYKGSEIQNYFVKLVEQQFRAAYKLQYVDEIPRLFSGPVRKFVTKKNQRGLLEELCAQLEMEHILDREIGELSGGELQRLAIMLTLLHQANVYIFDEPTSGLDIRQRLTASKAIRQHTQSELCDNYVILVEHDLSILDFLSDHICCLFGRPAAFGVVSLPYSVKEGINVFLDGYLPKDNMRFREYALNFRNNEWDEAEEAAEEPGAARPAPGPDQPPQFSYPGFRKLHRGFELAVQPGGFSASQILVLLGENGTGKTTFVKVLAGVDKAIEGDPTAMPSLKVSVKPQQIGLTFTGTVMELLNARLGGVWAANGLFAQTVYQPLSVEPLLNFPVKQLSGGERQRVALVLALGRPAEMYLIDEPSAFLDVEQRIVTAKVIKRFVYMFKRTAFVVEHDFIMATYLADRFIVYEGQPGRQCRANAPLSVVEGMNKFLSILGITFRRDAQNFRPRINKLNSQLDKEQKLSGNFFFVEK